MQLNTRHFGTLEIDEKEIINFPEGLPGFIHIKKYVILANGEGDSPFRWLQSVDEPDLAFAVVDPFSVKKDYSINIGDDVTDVLGIESAEDVLIYSIVVVPEDVSKISMNLKAPVIINTRNNKGMQVILDTDEYGVRHYILEELRRQEVGAHACSDKKEGTVHCCKR
jgi:flagellar assembly factor FliW